RRCSVSSCATSTSRDAPRSSCSHTTTTASTAGPSASSSGTRRSWPTTGNGRTRPSPDCWCRRKRPTGSQPMNSTRRDERARLLAVWALVGLVAVVQRSALFLKHVGDLDALIAANASWYTFQNLPREILRDHLVVSLIMLQQTPPASNFRSGRARAGRCHDGGLVRPRAKTPSASDRQQDRVHNPIHGLESLDSGPHISPVEPAAPLHPKGGSCSNSWAWLDTGL